MLRVRLIRVWLSARASTRGSLGGHAGAILREIMFVLVALISTTNISTAATLPIEWTNGELVVTVCTYQFSPPTIPCSDDGFGVASTVVAGVLDPSSSWERGSAGEFV